MLSFQIKSLQHPIVKHCVALRKEAAYRKEHDSFLVMGNKQLLEAPSHLKVLKVFTLEGVPSPINAKGCHYTVSQSIMEKICGMPSPEPYAAEIQKPHLKPEKLERLLVCEAISDPGNLGTLLRTALSFGFDAVYLLNHCVDPFNEKAIRAAKGALFHLPLILGDWDHLRSLQKTHSMQLYQADTEGTPMTECYPSIPFGLILGSESHGTSQEAKASALSISIPMTKKTESLNVAIAGGILMFNTSALCRKQITI